MWEILGIARNEKQGMRLCRCPDYGIGQFDPMLPTKADGTVRNSFVYNDNIETAQKAPCRKFEIVACADHDLHPGDDANCFLGVTLKLGTGGGNGIEVIDQNIGIEQRLHHSLRTFC